MGNLKGWVPRPHSLGRAVACALCLAGLATAGQPRIVPHGRLETLNGYTVVSVEGTPEEMGTAYGTLLGPLIRRVMKDVITDDVLADAGRRKAILDASRTMARIQPPEYLAEMRAIARAANVPYDELVLLQYFGDVKRAMPRLTGRS